MDCFSVLNFLLSNLNLFLAVLSRDNSNTSSHRDVLIDRRVAVLPRDLLLTGSPVVLLISQACSILGKKNMIISRIFIVRLQLSELGIAT